MPNPRELALRYLRAPTGGFWRWVDEGQALAWADGTTIAFRDEVQQVFAALGTRQLPPFGAIVLLLAACRENWSEVSDASGVLWSFAGVAPEGTSVGPAVDDLVDLLAEVNHGLDAINHLPSAQRSGTPAKAALARILFEPATTTPPGPRVARAQEEAAAGFRDGIVTLDILKPAESNPAAVRMEFAGTLRYLKEALSRFDPATFELRTRTGLDQLVTPAPLTPEELELPPSLRVRRMLESLRKEPEFAPLAALSRHLMAAVHLPRPVSAPDDLPLGGVSDISNRGPLDRLLLSELAHDDLMLAARVALNEALYLRREYPPQTPVGQRFILLDAGIRVWGVPRVFATAVALALSATADAGTELCIFRARGQGIEPVDLTTRDGLVAHLAALAPEPHPGAALPRFLAAAAAATGPAQALLVTHADTLDDPDFAAALASAVPSPGGSAVPSPGGSPVPRSGNQELFVATVDRDGKFRLGAINAGGRKPVAAADLDLDAVLAAPPPAKPLIDKKVPAHLPLICSVDPFPLLLPAGVHPDRACFDHRLGAFMAVGDGRLLWWRYKGKGAVEVCNDLPSGRVAWIGVDDRDVLRVLIRLARQQRHLALVSVLLPNLAITQSEFAHDYVEGESIWCQRGTLFFAGRRQVWAFDAAAPPKVASARLTDGVDWVGGKYVRRGSEWTAVTGDASGVIVEPLTMPPWLSGKRVLYLFDRPATDGPWAVTATGTVVSLAANIEIDAWQATTEPEAPGPLVVASNGDSIILQHKAGVQRAIQLTGARETWEKYDADWRDIEPTYHAWVHDRGLYKRFSAVIVHQGMLLLVPIADSRRGSAVLVRPGRLTWFNLGKLADTPGPQLQKPFWRTAAPWGARYELEVATFDDGSRVFRDSRGLLHLKSADPGVPELSLVLASDGTIAGWSSDGKTAGDPYFLPQPPNADAEHFTGILKAFTARLM